MFTLPILGLIFLVLVLLYLYQYVTERPPNFPPGPPKLPIFGSYWFLLKENYQHAHLSLEIIAKRYKTDILGLYLGNTPTVVTFSNELCKELLTREEFAGRNDTIITRLRGLGELKGIFFIDGLLWKEQRRFSLRHMRDFGFGRRSEVLENFVTGEVEYLIRLLNNEPNESDSDICKGKGLALFPDIFYGPMLNSILLILASTRYDYVKLRQFARAGLRFQRSSDATGTAISMAPWLRHVVPDFSGYTDAHEANQDLLDFIKEIVDHHVDTFSDDHHRDFIDDFIGERLNLNEAKNDWDYCQLLLTTLDYTFPAAIAIGHSLDFYFSYLVNNPNVQVKIQEEIDRVVGQSRLPTLDDRKFMPYTEATIREALRILPINPLGIGRRCMTDTTLAGYFIPKDTIMLPCVWTAHRDTKVWDNVEEFQPERFLDEQGNLQKKDYTMGFGAGKRLCAGETFGRQNMFLIVSGLLQSFTFKSPNGKPINLENIVPGGNLSLKENWIQAVPR